jgi:hypothetical protein
MPAREDAEFVTVADIEVEAVRPGRSGFTLDGRGADMTEYRLELHLDLPVDQRTRAVLGELLSQSEWRVQRRIRAPLKRGVRAVVPDPKPR